MVHIENLNPTNLSKFLGKLVVQHGIVALFGGRDYVFEPHLRKSV